MPRRCRFLVGVRHALLLIVALLDVEMPVLVVLLTDALLDAPLVSPVGVRDAMLLDVVPLDVVVPACAVGHDAAMPVPVVLLAGALLAAPLVSVLQVCC